MDVFYKNTLEEYNSSFTDYFYLFANKLIEIEHTLQKGVLIIYDDWDIRRILFPL